MKNFIGFIVIAAIVGVLRVNVPSGDLDGVLNQAQVGMGARAVIKTAAAIGAVKWSSSDYFLFRRGTLSTPDKNLEMIAFPFVGWARLTD